MKIAVIEDKGYVVSAKGDAVAGDLVGGSFETSIYSDNKGKAKIETNTDKGLATPALPSSPVKVNGPALKRTIIGTIETLTNFINERIYEIKNPQENIPDEK